METQPTTPSALCDLGEVHGGSTATIHSLLDPETGTGHRVLFRYRAWPKDSVDLKKKKKIRARGGGFRVQSGLDRLQISHTASSSPVICPESPPSPRLPSQPASSRCKLRAALNWVSYSDRPFLKPPGHCQGGPKVWHPVQGVFCGSGIPGALENGNNHRVEWEKPWGLGGGWGAWLLA